MLSTTLFITSHQLHDRLNQMHSIRVARTMPTCRTKQNKIKSFLRMEEIYNILINNKIHQINFIQIWKTLEIKLDTVR